MSYGNFFAYNYKKNGMWNNNLQHIHISDTVFAGFFHVLKPMALFNILFFKTTCKIAILIIAILIIGIFGIVNV